MKRFRFLALFLIVFAIFSNCGNQTKSEHSMKTYIKTGSVERLDTRIDDIIPKDELPEIIAEGFQWTEGPLWIPGEEILLFSDIPANSVFQWSEKDSIKLYLKPSGYTGTIVREGESGSNGLLLNSKGQLILCQHGDRRMARMNSALNEPAPEYNTIVDNWQGKRFNSPNDAVYNSRGDLFFTDPPYGLEQSFKDPKRELDFTGVYKFSTEGILTLLTDKMTAPNGIGLSPDEKKLYVANSGRGNEAYWMEFEMKDDGSPLQGKIFHDTSGKDKSDTGSPDGLKVRKDGTMFATGPGGVWIFSNDGDHLGTIKTGQPTSNCALDEKGRFLYMTANKQIMRIKLK